MLSDQSNLKILNVALLHYTACYRELNKQLCYEVMDSARIQWALKNANNIQRQHLEELISRVNLVVDVILPQQQFEQQNGGEALNASSVESTTKQVDNNIVGDYYSNTETKTVNEFNWLQHRQQTGYEHVESALAIEKKNNNKIVGDCFINTGHTESELSAQLKQSYQVKSQIFPTPIRNQQSEANVSDIYELQPLYCELSSNACLNESWQQETSFHSLEESNIRKSHNNKIVGDCFSKSGCSENVYQSFVKPDFGQHYNNEIVGDCYSNSGCTENVIHPLAEPDDKIVGDCLNCGSTDTASKTHESSPLINYLYYLYERPLSPVPAVTTVNDFYWQQQQTSYENVESDVAIAENNNNKIVSDCFTNVGRTEIELSAVVKQPDQVVSQLLLTPVTNQQSEAAVSDIYELQPLYRGFSSCATESNWLQQEHQETGYQSLVSSDIRENDNKSLGDCCLNFECAETALKTHEFSALLKQPDQVVSQLSQSQCIIPTPITSQQSEITVSDDCDEMQNLHIKCPMNDTNEAEGVTVDESLKELQLTRISKSRNYHDQSNYLYTRKNTRSLVNAYFRCKNRVRYGCPATAVAKNNDIANAILNTKHNHKSNIRRLHNEKFDKEMDKVCKENVLETPLKVYLKTKQNLINEIDTANVPPPKSKESFVRRRKIKKVPKLPKTILEFIEIMSRAQYKHFTENERKSTFYRGVWEANGDSNIVFISQDALETLNTLDNVTLLMDGTFKILPRHFRRRFRQLYVISFIYKGRSYPLAY